MAEVANTNPAPLATALPEYLGVDFQSEGLPVILAGTSKFKQNWESVYKYWDGKDAFKAIADKEVWFIKASDGLYELVDFRKQLIQQMLDAANSNDLDLAVELSTRHFGPDKADDIRQVNTWRNTQRDFAKSVPGVDAASVEKARGFAVYSLETSLKNFDQRQKLQISLWNNKYLKF